MMELKHEADVAIPERDEIAGGERRDVRVADRNRSAVAAIESAEQMKQRALPDA